MLTISQRDYFCELWLKAKLSESTVFHLLFDEGDKWLIW